MNTNTSYNHIAFLEAKATSLTNSRSYFQSKVAIYIWICIFMLDTE